MSLRRFGKAALIVFGVVLILTGLALWQRHSLLLLLLGTGEEPELLENVADVPGGEWFDDYFVIVALDANTFAIAEPRYWQRNFNYLIVGSERAVLFDAGAGHREIGPVVDHLTTLPVTFIPSHFHFDHVGNDISFDHVAVIDLPHLREQSDGNRLTLTWEQYLGAAEGLEQPVLEIDEWLPPNSDIDLGNRTLRLLYTPGHTDDSISLLDQQGGYLFTGDFLYPGPLAAIFPNSGMGDYLQATETIIAQAPPDSTLFGAHRMEDGGVPSLEMAHVRDLRDSLQRIRSGEQSGSGLYPRVYVVNDTLEIWADPAFLQRWELTYPED